MRIDNRVQKSAAACAAWLILGAVAVGAASAQNTPPATPAKAPATAPAAPAPSAGPAAIRIWNSDIHDAADKDLGGAPAIAIVAARGGAFSGKIAVGAAGPIKGLKASASDLKGSAGTIPAAAIRVRYAMPWDVAAKGRRPAGEDVLLDQAPAEIPGGKAPVWVTVSVPKDAKAGAYTGEVTVQADGAAPLRAAVKVDVQDWTLPPPQDYRTWVEISQSPDTLAVEYKTPLWSQRHWDLIAQSFRLLGGTGMRVVYVPLICQTNQGNEQTMVRWIKKGENQYDCDFTALEKYLDVAEKELGKPRLVVLYAWDVLLSTPSGKYTDSGDNDSDYQKKEKARLRARLEAGKKGIPVTGLDPASGEANTIYLPLYTDPAAKALWQPVWKGVNERLAKRGLEKAAVLGMLSDWRPSKPEAAVLDELSGHMPWGSASHHLGGLLERHTLGKLDGGGDLAMAMVALDYQFVYNPEKGRMYGWKTPYAHVYCWQGVRSFFNACTLSTARYEPECTITGGQRGIGRIGGDTWQCIKSKSGERAGTVVDRYPQAYWHSMNISDSLLAPGPDGPAGTVRLELFREGVQACEARIAIEAALTDDAQKAKVGADLAKRAQDTLDERQKALWRAKGADDADFAPDAPYRKYVDLLLTKWNAAKGHEWFLASLWQQREAKLYAIAGEVEKKAPAKP